MPDLSRAFPPFGLQVVAGPLTMRYPTDDDVAELAEIAVAGVHPPDRMPFFVPWTDARGDDLRTGMAQFYWRKRAEFRPQEWALSLAVRHGGRLVGIQAIDTSDFLVTRTGETGSWLGIPFQGKGIGTVMRRAICILAFDHLDFAEVTSGAFLDNPASLAVSRKVGYQDNGVRRVKRRESELALNRMLVLTPATLDRGGLTIEVAGLDALRRFVGLD